MGVLDEILSAKRDEVTLLHRPEVRDALTRTAWDAPPPRDFVAALRRGDGRLAVIAELKRRSPSKGELAPDLDPELTAKRYESGGAAAMSVLTDRTFFGGSIDDLRVARDTTHLPVLRKDFVIDPVQVYETRAIGADAVLLILAALPDDSVVRDLMALARALRLTALVEAHDARELDRAVALGASVVGVNARDLGTFAEDIGRSAELAARIPTEVVAVAESAVRSGEDAATMAAAGFDAVLVGEALVRSPDPTTLLHDLTRPSVDPRETP